MKTINASSLKFVQRKAVRVLNFCCQQCCCFLRLQVALKLIIRLIQFRIPYTFIKGLIGLLFGLGYNCVVAAGTFEYGPNCIINFS